MGFIHNFAVIILCFNGCFYCLFILSFFADASWLCVLDVQIALRVMFFIYVRVCMCVLKQMVTATVGGT